ncbi:MAG: hypothetical protein WC629_01385 [Candidatus Paceibacterota bacterium]|jgi:predicted GH43/DUF377 family glycosyl hydrolase
MFTVKRSQRNPILSPDTNNHFESYATFNGCPIDVGKTTHIVYRAQSLPEQTEGGSFSLSTIGHATSTDGGVTFKGRHQLIEPKEPWERFGCEDPRVTKIDDTFYIFYTALSSFPFGGESIKVAVALTKDFKNITERHLVTPFNAKAMTLFPEKIGGKYWALLTVNTDTPPKPSVIALAKFKTLDQIFDKKYWEKWYAELDTHVITIPQEVTEQVEIGAPPIKTKDGWLLVYSHIQRYFSDKKIFGIETVLLDLEDPHKIIGKTRGPILIPEETYELYGTQPNIIFPSGALIRKDRLYIFYGSTDTTTSMASLPLQPLLNSIKFPHTGDGFKRLSKEPILSPNPDLPWQANAVFNPTTLELGRKIHILYRAMSKDNTSVVGYAMTRDCVTILENLDYPIYTPRENFERKGVPGGNSGCEDARVTLIGDRIYMCYTAYNGIQPPQVALTSISKDNFLNKIWNWEKPILITRDGVDDKDACIHPEKVKGQYLLFHRVNHTIVGDYASTLEFKERNNFKNIPILHRRHGMWDGEKVGIAATPIRTAYGWILLYHGVSHDSIYRIGAALLDFEDPTKVLARTTDPVFEPMERYEKEGQIKNVVFPCGAIVRGDDLIIYYGGADSVVNVASISLLELVKSLLE